MAKLADIIKGRRARRTVPFPGIIDTEGTDQAELVLDVMVLDGENQALALQRAREFAKGKGVDAPKPGDPEYDLGHMVHTLLLACVDHTSPADAPAPFFSSVEQILKHLDRERIAFLHAQWEAFQDSLSPLSKALNEPAIWQMVVEAAAEEDPLRFFEKLPPATLARLLHFTAKQLVTVLQHKSGSSSLSALTGASASNASERGATH